MIAKNYLQKTNSALNQDLLVVHVFAKVQRGTQTELLISWKISIHFFVLNRENVKRNFYQIKNQKKLYGDFEIVVEGGGLRGSN